MNDFKNIDPLWSLSDPLTVQQSAALIAEVDPNAVRFTMCDAAYFENENSSTDSDGISRVKTAFAALINAINAGKLKATIRRTAWERGWNEEPDFENGERWLEKAGLLESDVKEAWGTDPTYIERSPIIYRVEPDWEKTTIDRSSLREGLTSNGIHTGFFFPDSNDAPGYLDSKNPRYAYKLAAAVRAWQAVTDPGKVSPKKALLKWLREHAAEFSLSDD